MEFVKIKKENRKLVQILLAIKVYIVYFLFFFSQNNK